MSPPNVFFISCSSTTFPVLVPPKTPSSPAFSRTQISNKPISRRNLAFFLSVVAPLLPSLQQPPPASAFSFGISGPKEWLKEQKKKSAKYLLAPIDASRNSLRYAYLLLTRSESEYSEKDLEEVKNLLRSAARDCVPEERNSFVDFQAKTGVEVCTFRLIVKNAASLLDDNNPVKLETEVKLQDLTRSFASLTGMADESDIRVASNRQRIAEVLMNTISSLNNFEEGVKDCLEN